MQKSYIEIIAKLLNGKLTSYKIAKDTGLTTQYIDNYRTGKSKIENMALGKAEILVKYASSVKTVSVNKSQWINLVGRVKNVEEAREMLGYYVYGWSSKESALETFKHSVYKWHRDIMNLKGAAIPIGTKPEELLPWLKEITIDDLADR